jgi:glycosyltransferase involved in cell wall biosynthesis
MKIIHCLNQYMPIAMAGTEIYTHTLAMKQKSAGHEVAVITPHIDYYRPGQIKEHYLYDEIDMYQFLETGDPTDRKIHYGYKKASGLENFKRLLIKLSPDVINFHELNRSIGFTTEHVKIAKLSGAKIFLTIHLSSYTCNTNLLIRDGQICDGKIRETTCSICTYKTMYHMPSRVAVPLALFSILSQRSGITGRMISGKVTTLLKVPSAVQRIKKELAELSENVDQFISYAKWYKNILIENGVPDNKITVVPAALVMNEKQPVSELTGSEGSSLKIVFIGRVQPQKGIHLIIEAVKHFTPEQVVVDLFGQEEDTVYYKKCIEDSKNVHNINWKGAVERSKVMAMLSHYDILCLASTFSEMSPLVIQEAFAAGIPVLASKVYGNMEHVADNHNGLLFEFNSSNNLREKIQTLIDNPALLPKLKSNIVTPLNFNVVNEAYLRLYDSW